MARYAHNLMNSPQTLLVTQAYPFFAFEEEVKPGGYTELEEQLTYPDLVSKVNASIFEIVPAIPKPSYPAVFATPDSVANGGPTLSLIEKITVGVGGSGDIYRDQTPDGKAYKFKNVLVKVVSAVGAAAGGAYVTAKNGGSSGVSLCILSISNAINTAIRMFHAKIFLSGGFWVAQAVETGATANSTTSLSEYMTANFSSEDYPCVDFLRISGDNGAIFPEGTIIEIYGA